MASFSSSAIRQFERALRNEIVPDFVVQDIRHGQEIVSSRSDLERPDQEFWMGHVAETVATGSFTGVADSR